MATTVENRLNGTNGATPTPATLAASAVVGTVGIANANGSFGAGRARYDAARQIHALNALRVDTSWEREGTPTLSVDLPPAGPWWVRWYVWMPALQSAGLGINEVRWHAGFPGAGLGLVIHETASGNIGTRLQPVDLAATSINWDSETGNAIPIGQWWRVELSYDGADFQSRVFAGHDTSRSRLHTWTGRGVGRTLEITGYRYRRGVLLRPGDTDAARGDTEVSDMQRDLMALGYELPLYGADGDYGGEATAAVLAFQQDHGYAVVDGYAGPETLSGITLALRLQNGEGYPPPLWVSHLAVSDSGPLGPADPAQDVVVPLAGTVRVASSGAFFNVQGPSVAPSGTVRVGGAAQVSRNARPAVAGTVRVSGSADVARDARPALAGTVRVSGEVSASRHAETSAAGTVRVSGALVATKHVVRALAATIRVSGSVVVRGGGRSAIALDYAAGHISDPFAPTEDDQDVANVVTVARDGGSSYTADVADGPLSVLDPPFGIGRYEESVTLPVAYDVQLRDHAGWRLRQGTVDAARYPTVTVDLAANPQLIQAVTSRDSGDALQVLNPPEWLPPESIELSIEGYTETLNAYTWTVDFNATPGDPWLIGSTDDPETPPSPDDSRADTEGSQLNVSVTSTANAFVVRTVSGPVWVDSANYPDSFPLDIRVGGEVMRVTAVTGTGSTQTFSVARALNAIRKPHAAGTPVSLAYPAYLGL